jgi:endoribonuclease Dicer
MAYNFPVIIYRIDSNLIALDACNMLGLPLRSDLALEAFTKDSDNTDEHDAEQINLQRGMGSNYERLEFLGDCFLKMATTISIFTLIPDKGEFEYHVERMLLICNKNLFNNALTVDLQEYIRSKSFNRRTWYPEGLTLKKGKRTVTKPVHVLADKSIADVCEAVIGAAYLTTEGVDDFDMAIKAVSIMVKDKKHEMTRWSDYYAAYELPEWQTAPSTPIQEDMAAQMEAKLGYRFKHPRLLRCAFMHPSYPSRVYERLPSYQRLEFLGDALLDMVCVDHLFRRFPGADPQWLTEHKMAMVSNRFLGFLAVSLGFHRHLISFSGSLQKEILSYVTEIEAAAVEASQDKEETASSQCNTPPSTSYWLNCTSPPKCIADVIESYIGAIFVDSGYDYKTVVSFFQEHILCHFADMAPYHGFASQHPITALAGVLQTRFQCTDWRLLARELNAGAGDNEAMADLVPGTTPRPSAPVGRVVAALRVHGHTLVHAVAASGRYAKLAAARKALALLEELDALPNEAGLHEYRARYSCQC